MDRADAAPDARVGGASCRPRGCATGARFRTSASGFARGCGSEPVALARARVAARLRAARDAAARTTPLRDGARGLVPAAGADRGGAAARRRRGARRARATSASDPRPAHALGELLHERGDELQLAAAAGAGRDPRLRGRARGGPPRRAGPLAALLAPAGLALPRLARARGAGCAATGTPCGLARYSQRKKRTARNSPAAAQRGHHERGACRCRRPRPRSPAESPSIRCFSGSASAIALSASGRSSAE